jgi:hypothetical protein
MKQLNSKLAEQFALMCKTGKLFRVALSGQEIWDLYLKSFEQDPIFRDPASTTHNCNLCNNFIRRYGNIVAIDKDFKIITMFDIDIDGEYSSVTKALSKATKGTAINEVFFETLNELKLLPYEKCDKNSTLFQLGMAKNVKRYTKEEAEKFGVVKPDQIITFDHMHLFLTKEFVDMTGKSVESIMGDYRDAKNVFQRAMETISLDTLQLVKDLILQGSLLDGQTHLYKIEQIIPLKKEYDSLDASVRTNWCWVNSYRLPFAKFKNELIGVLCSELSEGEDLNKACQSWNKRVDPVNYMKTTAPITKKQIEEAKLFVEENGYVESFDRRFATMDDIKVSEILHSNVGKGEIKSVSIFDGVKSTSTRHKRSEFDGVEEVSIDKFMKDILPGCTSIEVFLKNIHEGNMVSLTTAKNPESKPIFKWKNNYSWTFNGNLAGKSQIKEAVKAQGGKVDGVLRFSIMWAEGNEDNSDLDAHCLEPDGFKIYFSNKVSRKTGGNLDIDITQPQSHKASYKKDVVENITYPNLNSMTDGTYKMYVHQFNARNSKGFKAEIEFNGELYSYEYPRPVTGMVAVAEVTLSKGEFTIKHLLPESMSSRDIYGLETNQFHKVNLLCLSPNHWEGNDVGNKHYFFMLDGCKSPVSLRSFHNENLIPDLLLHRKVMEVLGSTHMIEPTDKQLSGLGFNATVRDEVLVRLSGNFKRMLKIKF